MSQMDGRTDGRIDTIDGLP